MCLVREGEPMSQTQSIDVTVKCWDCGEVRLYEEIVGRPENFSYACGNSTCREYGQRVGWLPDLCHVVNSPEEVAQKAEAKVLTIPGLDDRRLGYTYVERAGQTYQSLSHDDE